MKLIRFLAVACATFLLAGIANAQIKQGASSIGIFGSLQKTSDSSDISGSLLGTYDYFLTDNMSLSLVAGGFFAGGDNTFIGNANVSYYLSRDKVAPYIGAGAGYFGGGGGGGNGTYQAYAGFESFLTERTSLDTRVTYGRSFSSGSGSLWIATIGFKFYLK